MSPRLVLLLLLIAFTVAVSIVTVTTVRHGGGHRPNAPIRMDVYQS
jgi:hypothetical protein